MKYWNPSCECMSRDEMTKLQTERLIETVKRVYHNVPLYREKCKRRALSPETLKRWMT